MAKKRYDVMLEEDAVNELKAWLKPHAVTFSAYLNSLILLDLREIQSGAKDIQEKHPIMLATISKVVSYVMGEMAKKIEEKEKVSEKLPE